MQVNKTIKKHCQVLKDNKILEPKLPEKPNVIYRKTRTLKDVLPPSGLSTKNQYVWGPKRFFSPCKRWQVCKNSKTMRTSKFTSHVTSKTYNIEDFITCCTIGVIYLFRCLCGLQYVGRTTRALNCCHLANIRKKLYRTQCVKTFLIPS